MFFQYGNLRAANNEVNLASVSAQPERVDDGPIYRFRIQWNLEGELISTSATALTLALQELEFAYVTQEGSVAAFFEDNGTPTVHILGQGPQGGCRLVSFGYPQGGKEEYVISRKYSVTLEAFQLISGSPNIKAFEERISFEGGGLVYAWRRPLNAVPYRQGPLGRDTYRATQSGTAVGLYSRPIAPAPIWPEWLVGAPSVDPTSPKIIGSVFAPILTDYAISWTYRFESAEPLVGFPHNYPG